MLFYQRIGSTPWGVRASGLDPLSGAEAAGGQSVVDARGLASHFFQPPGLIADAHQEHGLVGVLEQIDNALVPVFEVDGLPVGNQMEVRPGLGEIGEPLAHFLLEEAQHAADFLQRKSLAAKFGDDGDFDDLRRKINAAVAFVSWRYHLALIPPLQLPQAHAREG